MFAQVIGVDSRSVVLGFPVALITRSASPSCFGARSSHTLKNSPRHELYGLQGLPLAYLTSLVSQKRTTSSMRSKGSSEVPIPTKAFGASMYVQYSRLGVGSRSWAGKENLTAARSETPINLASWPSQHHSQVLRSPSRPLQPPPTGRSTAFQGTAVSAP